MLFAANKTTEIHKFECINIPGDELGSYSVCGRQGSGPWPQGTKRVRVPQQVKLSTLLGKILLLSQLFLDSTAVPCGERAIIKNLLGKTNEHSGNITWHRAGP